MPRLVDHEQRRAEVAAVARSVIVRSGLEALTVREVAKAAGYSTAIVSHYFADKRQFLLYIYRWTAMRAEARVRARFDAAPHDLLASIESLLPIEEERRQDWLVWFAFWGWAASDPEFAREQRSQTRMARDMVASLIAAAIRDGTLIAETDHADLALRLITLVDGIAIQAIFDPDDWSGDRQRAAIRRELAPYESGPAR